MATTLRTFMRRDVGTGLAAGALAGILVACGGGTGSGGASALSAPERSGDPGTIRVDVKLVDYKVEPSRSTLKAGVYTFVARNAANQDHALEIEGHGLDRRTKTLAPGESANLTVKLKDGKYEAYCPIDSHKELGMKTVLTVSGTSSQGGGTNTADGHGH
ncbi:cupredoxin domain-containing protein [Streptomyces sp. KM273126]|uniref:cupredoxin domain-containing protein n=1 Tax=Streptomyces sp. KM273126 TaxID=2545247 RepID=UPI00103DBD2B|nr:cupredoxin domain-containing protein [Streptomyces sp. KM273126]MBA2811015.1 cupredoxin domain-containing protein [Streptomyces sp. KM273126]